MSIPCFIHPHENVYLSDKYPSASIYLNERLNELKGLINKDLYFSDDLTSCIKLMVTVDEALTSLEIIENYMHDIDDFSDEMIKLI